MIPDDQNPPMTQEQVEYFAALQAESTARAVRRASRRQMKQALVGFLILLIGVLAYSVSAQHNLENATKAADKNLNAGLVQSCKRVNLLRAQSNVSDFVIWDILTASAQRERALAKSDDPVNKDLHSASARVFEQAAQRLSVTALTNCTEAVRVPDAYPYPEPGPLGDVMTGKLTEDVKGIIKDSQRAIQRNDVPDKPFEPNGG